MTEEEFNRWSQAANACVTAGKRPGKPWTIQVTAHCPFTGKKIGCQAKGKTESLRSAMDALLACSALAAVRAHPMVQNMLNRLVQ